MHPRYNKYIKKLNTKTKFSKNILTNTESFLFKGALLTVPCYRKADLRFNIVSLLLLSRINKHNTLQLSSIAPNQQPLNRVFLNPYPVFSFPKYRFHHNFFQHSLHIISKPVEHVSFHFCTDLSFQITQ